MKTIIQISVLLLAILVGSIWQIFRPEIHDFLRVSEPTAGNGEALPQKIEPAKLDFVAKPSLAEPGTSQKKALPDKMADEPAKVVLAPKIPVIVVPSSEEMKRDREEQIQRIVMERYPDIENIPFSEKYPDLSKLPRAAFPERIQIRQKLNFKLTQEEKIVGISIVKVGGFVRPHRVEGDKIKVSSLADKKMVEEFPLSETDFLAVIKANYDVALEQAITRLEKMREADKTEILKNPDLYKRLIEESETWHDSEDVQFEDVKMSYGKTSAASRFKPVSFFATGYVMIDEEGPYSGGYSVVIALLEEIEAGFGPYHWRAKCLFRDGRIVGWLGLPEKSSGD